MYLFHLYVNAEGSGERLTQLYSVGLMFICFSIPIDSDIDNDLQLISEK